MRRALSCSLAVAACLQVVVFAASCSSKSSAPHDAGVEASGPTCEGPSGSDFLSFDVTCTANCTVSRHVTFNVSAGDRESAPCVDASGHLQLYQLVGDDQSIFELDLEPGYAGAGSYSLGAGGLVQYSNVSTECKELGTVAITMTLPDPNDPKGSCSVDVGRDCSEEGGRHHGLTGTFDCTFPVTDRGADCKIENGTFSFAACE